MSSQNQRIVPNHRSAYIFVNPKIFIYNPRNFYTYPYMYFCNFCTYPYMYLRLAVLTKRFNHREKLGLIISKPQFISIYNTVFIFIQETSRSYQNGMEAKANNTRSVTHLLIQCAKIGFGQKIPRLNFTAKLKKNFTTLPKNTQYRFFYT